MRTPVLAAVFLSLGLIVAGAMIPGSQAAAADQPPQQGKNEIKVIELNPENLQKLQEMKEKQIADQKAKEEKTAEAKERQEKIEKYERRTGSKPKSWQVLNR